MYVCESHGLLSLTKKFSHKLNFSINWSNRINNVSFTIAQTTANNVTILNESILPNGNTVLILGEVLFVTEAVVSKLHQVRALSNHQVISNLIIFFGRCTRIKKPHHYWRFPGLAPNFSHTHSYH